MDPRTSAADAFEKFVERRVTFGGVLDTLATVMVLGAIVGLLAVGR